MEEEKPYKLQPIMLLIPERLECGECGALAIIMAQDRAEEDEEKHDYRPYCQDCWHKRVVTAQEEEEI